MARPLRLEIAGGLYHVTSRGDRREDIYHDDADRDCEPEKVPENFCPEYRSRGETTLVA